jgi:two-component system chemotaxis response regulator CheB
VRAVGIVAATGGPAALHFLLRRLPYNFPAPILIVQHITLGFVPGLVEWLSNDAKLEVRLGQPGEVPQPGQALFAPDDTHMAVDSAGFLTFSDEDPVDGHRPSGTVLLRSIARAYGAQAVGAVLTGMGTDGAAGLLSIKTAGGMTIAQDEASSVVYGMPREAAAIGAAQEILSLERMVAYLLAIVP